MMVSVLELVTSRLRFVAGVSLLLLGLGACTERISRPEQMQTFLNDVYFSGPLDRHVGGVRRLSRWEGPLRVWIDHDQVHEYRSQVQEHLARFTELTGLEASVVDYRATANVHLLFTPGEDFVAGGVPADCVARISNRGGRIEAAEIAIGVTDEEEIRICIAHELYHVFGLRFHSVAADSLMSMVHRAPRPTAADDYALEVLYGPALRPGMTAEDAAQSLVAATANLTDDLGEHWEAMLPSDSQFEVPPVAAGRYASHHVRRYQHYGATEFALWYAPSRTKPLAAATVINLDHRYQLKEKYEIDYRNWIRDIALADAKSMEFGEESEFAGRYGPMSLVDLKFRGDSCLGYWKRKSRTDDLEFDRMLVVGYICSEEKGPVDRERATQYLYNMKIRAADE